MLRRARSLFSSRLFVLRVCPGHKSRSYCEELPKELQSTEILLDLLRYEPKERVDSWTQRFYDALPLASLKGDISPQVIKGPDQMLYFRLAIPHYGEKFEAYSFSNPKFMSFCIEHGFGAIIFNNPYAAEKADFKNSSFHALTYGQILSFHHYNNFLGDPKDIYEIREKQVDPYIEAQTEWHKTIIPPDSHYLPKEVRSHLKFYINTVTDNMREPKVAMKVDPELAKKGNPSRILTFNYCIEDFGEEEHAQAFIECVQWYLPPSMSVSLLQSRAMQKQADSDEGSPFIEIDSNDYITPQHTY